MTEKEEDTHAPSMPVLPSFAAISPNDFMILRQFWPVDPPPLAGFTMNTHPFRLISEIVSFTLESQQTRAF
eukprot:3038332-Rhodomonas_salina.2